MDNKYVVYMHKNKANNKIYIGMTGRNVIYRWKNGKGYVSNKHFYRSIEKYGWDGFEHIILADNLSKWKAEKYEISLIEQYQSTDCDKGYNKATGGDVNCGYTYTHTEEAKEKIRLANKGKKVSEATRKKISISNSGKIRSEETKAILREKNSGLTHPCYGKKTTEETKKKQSNSKIGMYDGKNNPSAKKVLCNGDIFECAKDFANAYDLKYSTIVCWLNGSRNMPKEYIEMGLSYCEENIIHIAQGVIKNSRSKKVNCDGIIFDSVKECSEYLSISKSYLSVILNGKVDMPSCLMNRNICFA